MARIVFDDGGGEVTLISKRPAPADRFANWIPANYRPRVNGAAHALADDRRFVFSLRDDFGASFEMEGLPMGDEADEPLDRAVRLIAHLKNGGTCEVHTDDELDASFENCGLAPESEPSISQVDRRAMEYTLALALLNLDQTPMTCHYGPA